MECILVSWGCCTELPQFDGIKQLLFIFSQLWRPEVEFRVWIGLPALWRFCSLLFQPPCWLSLTSCPVARFLRLHITTWILTLPSPLCLSFLPSGHLSLDLEPTQIIKGDLISTPLTITSAATFWSLLEVIRDWMWTCEGSPFNPLQHVNI